MSIWYNLQPQVIAEEYNVKHPLEIRICCSYDEVGFELQIESRRRYPQFQNSTQFKPAGSDLIKLFLVEKISRQLQCNSEQNVNVLKSLYPLFRVFYFNPIHHYSCFVLSSFDITRHQQMSNNKNFLFPRVEKTQNFEDNLNKFLKNNNKREKVNWL